MSYRTRRSGRRRNYGYERAQSHIEEAAAFTALVGEADAIVRRAFFALSGRSLKSLLDKYEKINGVGARQYAEQTISKWRNQERQMSGLVAKRLFDLMPPLMPIAQKHEIVEVLWKRFGPRSSAFLYVGPDADCISAIAAIEQYYAGLTMLYEIPQSLEKQFGWLTDNDVVVKQQLLNYFMDAQRSAAIASARLHIDVMLSGLQADVDGQISKLTHTVYVGNHAIEIVADHLRSGFAFSKTGPTPVPSRPPSRMATVTTSSPFGFYIVCVLIVIAIIWAAMAASRGTALSSQAPLMKVGSIVNCGSEAFARRIAIS